MYSLFIVSTITRMNKNWRNICCFSKNAKQDIIPLWENTKPYIPEVTSGVVIKVYDGDTITIASYLPYNIKDYFRFPIRLLGIDCPEIKGSSEEEKTMAKEARDYLSQKILGKKVILKNVSIEKYGRLLADVYLDKIHINNLMIMERYAVKYDGGTKKCPTSWLKYKLTSEMN